MSSNNLSSIPDFSSAKNLKIANFTNNKISDLLPLAYNTKLITLLAGNNTISDISFLKNLSNLDILTLNNNHISDASPLINNKKITGLDLQGNPLSRSSKKIIRSMGYENYEYDGKRKEQVLKIAIIPMVVLFLVGIWLVVKEKLKSNHKS